MYKLSNTVIRLFKKVFGARIKSGVVMSLKCPESPKELKDALMRKGYNVDRLHKESGQDYTVVSNTINQRRRDKKTLDFIETKLGIDVSNFRLKPRETVLDRALGGKK